MAPLVNYNDRDARAAVRRTADACHLGRRAARAGRDRGAGDLRRDRRAAGGRRPAARRRPLRRDPSALHLVSYAAGAVLLLHAASRARFSARDRAASPGAPALATLMLAASVYSGLVVAGRIHQPAGATIGVAPSSLPDDDPRRIEFGRLHGLRPRCSSCRCSAASC